MFRWFNDPQRAFGAVMAIVNPLLRPVGLTVLIIAAVVLLALTRRDVVWRLVALRPRQGSSPTCSTTL